MTGKYRIGQPFPEGSRGEAKNWPLDKPAFRCDWERAEKLVPLAAEAGETPTQMTIAWLLGRPGVTSVIIGSRTTGQLEDNLKAWDATLPPDLLRRVDEISPSPGA